MRVWLGIAFMLLVGACEPEALKSLAPLYDTTPVEIRAIEVTVEASGVIEPEITVEVKSKASGEVLAMYAEIGDVVEADFLLVEIDQRTPRNRLAEAEAGLVAATARRAIADTQMERSRTLFASGTVTETDFEQSQLEFANAQAQVIGMEVAVESGRIAMDDTEIRAPITGTIIERNVEPGTVISSPTRNVSGGSILLKMADLSTVQVRTLVKESDIGKIRQGMSTRVTIAAYPNQPFDGEVLKIEPQAIVERNVTMFAVLIRLENQDDLLKPGMNAEVEIQIASRDAVPAVPTIALRAQSDIPMAAVMLGLAETELREMLAESVAEGSTARRDFTAQQPSAGRGNQLPVGVNAVSAASSYVDDRSAAARSMASGTNYQFGGDYWVITMQDGEPIPVSVRTGLTDLEYSEIIDGLDMNAQVLLLPSSSLFEQQEALQKLISARLSTSPFQQSGGGGRYSPH